MTRNRGLRPRYRQDERQRNADASGEARLQFLRGRQHMTIEPALRRV